MADLVDNYFVAPRVALANGEREMISMLKIVHRKNLLQPIQKLKERQFNFTSVQGSSRFTSIFGFICTCNSQTFVTV